MKFQYIQVVIVLAIWFNSSILLAQTGWIAQNPLPQSEHLHKVYRLNIDTAWAVGDNGAIIKTTNGGVTWYNQTSGTTWPLWDVKFIDANIGFIVGFSGVVLTTSDGGATWNSVGLSTSFYASDFIDASNGWVAGAFGEIYHTTDGGTTWNAQTSGTSDNIESIQFLDANNGWAVGYNGLILGTSDGGTNWFTYNSGVTDLLQSVFFSNASTGWAVGWGGTILNTTDGGLNWILQNAPVIDIFYDVFFVDDYKGWIVGNNGTILSTTDGGINWQEQTSGTTNKLYSIQFTNQLNGFIVGDNGYILKTSTGGSCNSNLISGVVNYQGNPVVNGTAYLVRQNGVGSQNSYTVDTASVALDGTYYFDNLAPEMYSVAAKGDTAIYNSVLTYSDSSDSWLNAITYDLTSGCADTISTANIYLKDYSSTANYQGSLTGVILQGGPNRAGDPIPGVDISLEQIPGGIIDSDKTNDNGEFSMKFSESGSYLLKVNLPGFVSDTLDLLNIDTVNSLNYSVQICADSNVYTVEVCGIDDNTSVKEIKEGMNSISVYPNPITGSIINYAILGDGISNFCVDVYNVLGEKLSTYNLVQNQNSGTIDLKNTVSGTYFLVFKNDETIIDRRIVEVY